MNRLPTGRSAGRNTRGRVGFPLPVARFPLNLCAFCLLYSLLSPIHSPAAETANAQALQPGKEIEITFSVDEVPPTLYSVMNGAAAPPCLTFRLPDDYSPTNRYPLVLYVPGNDGGARGNPYNARTMAGARGWIAATLPLFKKAIDRTEPVGGVIVGFEDYPVLSKAYRTMLGRLFERAPNIDPEKSAMVGFSNGAIAIGVLVSNHDEFILTHFRNFCLVDHGMFHLADLHKSRARGCRFLILVGDQEDFGRELRIRQSQLLDDSWKLLNVNVTHRILKDTGHEFNEPQMEIVSQWLRSEVEKAPLDQSNTNQNP